MAKTKYDMNSGISWLEKVLLLYKAYGVLGILKGLLILILLSVTLRICYNPEIIFDKYIEYTANKHINDIQQRDLRDERVKCILPNYLYKYHADRVWIVQYHNGIMDWQHGTMRFELCGDHISSIKYQYSGFNLTWLDLPYYLKAQEVFIGNLEELNKIDRTLCSQLEKNNIQYIACIILRDSNDTPIGIFGISWEHIPLDLDPTEMYIKLINIRATLKPLVQMEYNKN